ncbi:TonB-dependent receptor [Aestuariicella hydrocarbonica]|uniref:TonB-dependent receptor n=1 Tax=Pseudomaricurvus hydrocarbonicus TaxID=1470433 RepID=A0A9E5MNM9_9GAMM|nr:TonB-dependent receptor [Aestuariicella hydrocarbonica]NHO67529.1 TonB-dependent receptor [Aestuariicella hydrocarbonica]
MRLYKPMALAIAVANASIAAPALAEDVSERRSSQILEEVLVTATKRETNLMDTPVAISAFTEADLIRQGINNVKDLGNLVPSLDIAYDQDQSSPVIAMRGVRSTNTSELGDPSVGLHMDGIYSPRPQGAMALMFDVERVEALRGPQGTLFGRNSTVGTINVISKRPVIDEFEANVGVEAGSWDQRLIKGMINIPVSETLALRASFMDQTRDSYLDGYYDANQWDRRRLPDDAKNAPLLDGDAKTLIQERNWWSDKRELVEADEEDFYNNIDQYAFRISALWEPTDDLSWMMTYEKFQDKSAGNLNTIDCDKAAKRLTEDADGNMVAGQAGCDSVYGPGADEYTVVVNTPGKLDLSIDSVRSNFRWDFSDTMALVYNAGYASQKRSALMDIDAGVTDWDMELNFVDTQYQSQSHELQIQSTNSGPLQWIAGAFYFKEKNDMKGYFNAHMNDSTFWDQPNRTLESQAYFAQGTYQLTDRLNLTLGYRWTEDTKQDKGGHNKSCVRDWALTPSDAGFPGCYPAWVFDAPGYEGDPSGFFNSYSPDHFDNPAIYSDTTNNDTKGSWSASTYRIGLDYDLTEDIMLYGYVANGFKSGGIGDVVVQYEQDPLTAEYPLDADGNRIVKTRHDSNYDPEEVTTFELGAKASLLDGRLNLSGTFFYSDYQDMQLASPESVFNVYSVQQDPTSDNYGEVETNGFVVYRTKNAAESEIKGFEFEFDWMPYPNGRVSGFATWLKTEITSDFVTRFDYGATDLFQMEYGPAHDNDNMDLYRNLKGNELAASPEYSVTINYDHTFHLDSGARVIPFVGLHWEDESYLTYWNVDKHDFPNANTEAHDDTREAFYTVNMSIKYISANEQWDVEAFGYNVTDESIPYWAGAGDGVVRGSRSVPANYGVRLNYSF